MLSRLSMWILKTLGWEIHADLPDIKKYVAIAAPHTSNWDFPLGILTAKAINLKVHWMGKHTLFRWPYAWFFRLIGGTPIQRDGGQNYIEQMRDLFERSEQLVLALAPEGTRGENGPLENWFLLHRPCCKSPDSDGLHGFWKQTGRYRQAVISERGYRSGFRPNTPILCRQTW